ncbi:MAG: radical SAM protein [Acidobacteriota bacterium]|nr:radical SAM protein [Acidobacteriota bacterium]MDH3783975.1 radical SAM protein [Acidobacteriota bacterium]
MIDDPARNPGLLKLDLYCKGMQIDESCFIADDGGRPILRTRAGLGSGLELILPDGLWTNVPVTESFTEKSPYTLKKNRGQYEIHRDGAFVAGVELSPQPEWYEWKTTNGRLMRRIGTLQGTYLGVYPARVCEYWLSYPGHLDTDNCKFCSVGLNLGKDDGDEKQVEEVVEVAIAAWRESGVTYVDFNTGHYDGHTFLDILEPYIRRVKEETGVLIGVQTPPHPDLSRYDRLKELGVNRVSFCFEIFDQQRFEEICPGKHREYGLDTYLKAVDYCAQLGMGQSLLDQPWVSNGEIIAGLESPESSIKAIDWITDHGAIPTVCVFRPLLGTDLAETAPPSTEDMVPVFRRLYEACMENDLPIGLAPNINVSLVMLPEEGRYLLDNPDQYRGKEFKLAVKKKLFRAKFMTEQNLLLRKRKASQAASTPS